MYVYLRENFMTKFEHQQNISSKSKKLFTPLNVYICIYTHGVLYNKINVLM